MVEPPDVGLESLAEDLHVDFVGEALCDGLGDLQLLEQLLAAVPAKLVRLHRVRRHVSVVLVNAQLSTEEGTRSAVGL